MLYDIITHSSKTVLYGNGGIAKEHSCQSGKIVNFNRLMELGVCVDRFKCISLFVKKCHEHRKKHFHVSVVFILLTRNRREERKW
jgi:hypothetical protein